MESNTTAPAKTPWKGEYATQIFLDLDPDCAVVVTGIQDQADDIVAWVPQGVDASFIVRACNTHDELVGACEWLISELCEAWDEPPEKAIPAPVREALARAKSC